MIVIIARNAMNNIRKLIKVHVLGLGAVLARLDVLLYFMKQFLVWGVPTKNLTAVVL